VGELGLLVRHRDRVVDHEQQIDAVDRLEHDLVLGAVERLDQAGVGRNGAPRASVARR